MTWNQNKTWSVPRPQVGERPTNCLRTTANLRCLPDQHAPRRRRANGRRLRAGRRDQSRHHLHRDHRLGRESARCATSPAPTCRRSTSPASGRSAAPREDGPRSTVTWPRSTRRQATSPRQAVLMGLLARKRTGKGPTHPRGHAPRGHGPAERTHRRIPKHRQPTSTPRLSRIRHRPPIRRSGASGGDWIGVSVTSEDEWRRFAAVMRESEAEIAGINDSGDRPALGRQPRSRRKPKRTGCPASGSVSSNAHDTIGC